MYNLIFFIKNYILVIHILFKKMAILAKIMQAFLGIESIWIRERKAFSIQRGWTKFALRTIYKK